MAVLMRHPESGGEYDAQPSQVPHLQEAGWQVAPGQDEQGEQWPAELRRFEGQPQVRMRHPEVEGQITVAESAVPFHRERGWQVVEPEPSAAAEEVGDLEGLTLVQLQDRARDAGLPVSGTKADLAERLRGAAAEEKPAEPAGSSEEE